MRNPFPPKQGDASLFVRSDFSDDAVWEAVSAAADADVYEIPDMPFHARLIFISDREYEGVSPLEVAELAKDDPGHRVVFVVDGVTVQHPDHPILAVDSSENPGSTLRVVPSKVWMIENNVNEVNAEFSEYVERAARSADQILR